MTIVGTGRVATPSVIEPSAFGAGHERVATALSAFWTCPGVEDSWADPDLLAGTAKGARARRQDVHAGWPRFGKGRQSLCRRIQRRACHRHTRVARQERNRPLVKTLQAWLEVQATRVSASQGWLTSSGRP